MRLPTRRPRWGRDGAPGPPEARLPAGRARLAPLTPQQAAAPSGGRSDSRGAQWRCATGPRRPMGGGGGWDHGGAGQRGAPPGGRARPRLPTPGRSPRPPARPRLPGGGCRCRRRLLLVLLPLLCGAPSPPGPPGVTCSRAAPRRAGRLAGLPAGPSGSPALLAAPRRSCRAPPHPGSPGAGGGRRGGRRGAGAGRGGRRAPPRTAAPGGSGREPGAGA